MKFQFKIFLVLLTICTPLVIITSGMQIALSPLFYKFEYRLPNFPPDTYGFTTEDRQNWADYSIKYISGKISDEEFSSLRFPDGTPLFNLREISHMVDVRVLTMQMLIVWRVLLVIFIISIYVCWKTKTLKEPLLAVGKGARITILIILGIFLYVMINFNQLFTIFHQIFFEGDSWLFYYSDTLIRLFPIKFWQDLFIFIGAFGLITSVLIIFFEKKLDK